jgi:hypothetical protein
MTSGSGCPGTAGPTVVRESFSPWDAREHGPLPLFLLMLTFITGLVDALS